MKCKQLIELLRQVDGDTPVVIEDVNGRPIELKGIDFVKMAYYRTVGEQVADQECDVKCGNQVVFIGNLKKIGLEYWPFSIYRWSVYSF